VIEAEVDGLRVFLSQEMDEMTKQDLDQGFWSEYQ